MTLLLTRSNGSLEEYGTFSSMWTEGEVSGNLRWKKGVFKKGKWEKTGLLAADIVAALAAAVAAPLLLLLLLQEREEREGVCEERESLIQNGLILFTPPIYSL